MSEINNETDVDDINVVDNAAKLSNESRESFYTVNESILQAGVTMSFRKTEYSEWKCLMFGSTDFTFTPQKGGEPNWFWRGTQHLILGHKWINRGLNDD